MFSQHNGEYAFCPFAILSQRAGDDDDGGGKCARILWIFFLFSRFLTVVCS